MAEGTILRFAGSLDTGSILYLWKFLATVCSYSDINPRIPGSPVTLGLDPPAQGRAAPNNQILIVAFIVEADPI